MLKIPENIYNKMISHCISELPNEACGILAGIKNVVNKIYMMTNIEKSPESFLMDPKEQIQVLKDIRESKLEMLAIFHSHPSTPARPSQKDIKMAFYEDIYYIIISLKGLVPETKAFKIYDNSVKEEIIVKI